VVRRIRDAHYEQLRARSPEEWIAFYCAKARELQSKISAQREERPVDESQPCR